MYKSNFAASQEPAASSFPSIWPKEYKALAQGLGENGPLLKMGVPHPSEHDPDAEIFLDPVGDGELRPIPGIIQKYADKALILAASKCFFYCRFCFRRNESWEESFEPNPTQWKKIALWLDDNPKVTEVILSGGDPLTLDNDKLTAAARILESTAHVKKWRIHTRAPVVLPSRVDEKLLQALSSRLPLSIVLHANHPAEIRPAVLDAISKFKAAGVKLLSQTVLLAGVNDNPDVLEELFRRLHNAGVKPYYLHNLDRAHGNKRFRLPIEKGLAIHAELFRRASLFKNKTPPPYVIDLPNGAGKTRAEKLTPTARENRNGRSRIRYRWTRTKSWNALVKDEVFEWWDVWG